MTWIVGASTLLGYAVGISDIRVTFGDGSESDCLQKLHYVNRFIAAGFAGSVRIGFSMLENLAYRLRDLPEGNAWLPDEVAEDFQEIAKHVFQREVVPEQRLGAQLMFLGGQSGGNATGLGRCYVHILESPDFKPQLAELGQVVSIGCGRLDPRYREMLDGFSSDIMSLLHGETAGPGMGSLPLVIAVQQIVEKHPVRGISPHAHICIVRQNSVSIQSNDHDTYPQTGEKIEFRMPPVATSRAEFEKMFPGSLAEGAVC